MKCKNCNAENSDGANFCNICGAKLDEEFICAKCGAVLKSDDVFCSRCGEKIESESENGSDIQNSTRNGFCKGMNVAALAMSVCLAVITVIFVFFMGCKGGGIISLPQGEPQEINLFYYFGNAWKELNNLPELADTYKTSVYLRIILGLLIYASTLFTVLVLSIMSVVRNLNVLTKQGDKTGINLSLMSFFVFVAGAMGLFFIHSVSIGLDLPYNSEIPKKILNALKELTTKLNGATIAGFAVGGVFLALMTIFALLSNEKKRFNAFNILNFFLSLVGIAFLTVFAAMFLKPFTTFTYSYSGYPLGYDEYYVDYNTMIGYGPFTLLSNGARMIDSGVENGQIIMVLSAIGFVFACGALVIGYISRAIKGIIYNENETNIQQFASSIVLVVLSTITLSLTIVANNYFKDVILEQLAFGEEEISFSYIPPIVMLIMSVLALGVEIARLITTTKMQRLTPQ